MLEAVEGRLYLLEVLEVPTVSKVPCATPYAASCGGWALFAGGIGDVGSAGGGGGGGVVGGDTLCLTCWRV